MPKTVIGKKWKRGLNSCRRSVIQKTKNLVNTSSETESNLPLPFNQNLPALNTDSGDEKHETTLNFADNIVIDDGERKKIPSLKTIYENQFPVNDHPSTSNGVYEDKMRDKFHINIMKNLDEILKKKDDDIQQIEGQQEKLLEILEKDMEFSQQKMVILSKTQIEIEALNTTFSKTCECLENFREPDIETIMDKETVTDKEPLSSEDNIEEIEKDFSDLEISTMKQRLLQYLQ